MGNVVKFDVPDMVKAIEQKKGHVIFEGLNYADAHVGNRGEDAKVGIIGQEMNGLMQLVCQQRGIQLGNEKLSLFNEETEKYIPDDAEKSGAWSEANKLIHAVVMEVFHKDKKATKGFEREFLEVEGLLRGTKMMNHEYFNSFEKRHGLKHKIIQEVYHEISYDIRDDIRKLGHEFQPVMAGDRLALGMAMLQTIGIQLSPKVSIQSIVEKDSLGFETWELKDSATGLIYKFCSNQREWVAVWIQNDKKAKKRYLLEPTVDGFECSTNTYDDNSPYNLSAHGEVAQSSLLYQTINRLHQRILNTADYQLSQADTDYENAKNTRLSKFRIFNQLFAKTE